MGLRFIDFRLVAARRDGDEWRRDYERCAEQLRRAEAMAVLIPGSCPGGTRPLSVGEVSQVVREFPEVYRGVADVSPDVGTQVAEEVRAAGLSGLGSFSPVRQGFRPDADTHRALWAAAADAGLFVVFDMGLPGSGAGTGQPVQPGFLEAGRPVPHLDAVAADLPQLRIVTSSGWPYIRETLAVARHKSNVTIGTWGDAAAEQDVADPETFVYRNSVMPGSFVFGSGSVLDVTRGRDAVQRLEGGGYKPESLRKILLGNAKQILNI